MISRLEIDLLFDNFIATENGKFEEEKKPSMFDWHEKAKYKSWKKVRNLSINQAMTKYVEKVEFIQKNKLADFEPNEKEKKAMLKESASKYISI